jgi:hypothetical protein
VSYCNDRSSRLSKVISSLRQELKETKEYADELAEELERKDIEFIDLLHDSLEEEVVPDLHNCFYCGITPRICYYKGQFEIHCSNGIDCPPSPETIENNTTFADAVAEWNAIGWDGTEDLWDEDVE